MRKKAAWKREYCVIFGKNVLWIKKRSDTANRFDAAKERLFCSGYWVTCTSSCGYGMEMPNWSNAFFTSSNMAK